MTLFGFERDGRGALRPTGLVVAGVVAAGTVLAACSAGSTTSSLGPGGTGKSGVVTADVVSAGWDCPAGTCSWGADPTEVAAFARAGIFVRGSGAPSTKDNQTMTSRQGTPLSVDDNEDVTAYLEYEKSFLADGDAPAMTGDRFVVKITNRAGDPVPGATIEVGQGAGTVVARAQSRADGRAIVFVPSDLPPPGVGDTSSAQFAARITKGAATTEVTLGTAGGEVEATLDVATPTAEPPAVDIVFLLDATASMNDDITRLKAHMGDVLAGIENSPSHPDLRVGMTLYRDDDEDFATRTFALASPATFLDAFADVAANGGGDTPEDVDAGLAAAVSSSNWRGGDTAKLIVLVGDAPPHLDDRAGSSYLDSARLAAAAGIKVVAVGAPGLDRTGQFVFRQVARATLGRFVALEATDGLVDDDQVTTPAGYGRLALDTVVRRVVIDDLPGA